MGRLMGSSNSNNYGEQIFINKASEYLDDTNIIYWNRQLFGKEFDVCILMPEKGILVVELKGWREENILRIENNDSVIIQTNDGEVSASPQKQARGYRFSIERHIRQNIGKFPLVYQMVCLPQVSKAFFKSHRLDVVMEEKFTILKEDLKDNTSFFNKLDQALREVCHWNRDPFDRRTMLEVRNLFETDINVDEDGESEIEKELASSYHRHDYSRFYYFNEFDQMSGNTINDMVAQYLHGCKLYCVFSKKAQMLAVIKALDTALTQRGLVRNRDNIEIAFDEQKSHTPLAESVGDMFMGFHCSMSVLSAPFDKNTTSFAIPNGSYSSAQKRILEKLSEQSQFNFEQYQVEHATPEKNIVIRAGAGTGKTYTMISRIGFICYTQNVPLQKMADRIVMITFTNEAADQMEEKLKACILGQKVDTSSPHAVIKSLFKDFKKDDNIKRDTREWNDMIQFVLNRKADFESALIFLKQASATTMGAVHFAVDPNTKSCFRADELVVAVEKLMAVDWDIEAELPNSIPQKHLLYNPATLLKALYPSVKKAMAADAQEAATVVGKLEGYIGKLTQENLIAAFSAIQSLFAVFAANGIIGSAELRVKYDKPPIDTAKDILAYVKLINDAAGASAVKQLTVYAANPLNALYVILRDIQAIALLFCLLLSRSV